ncbi:MAG: InlB B-repeat-containing protein, partial [Oscillospiraceae bacterium]|nr:InlB B-repeat-containing protein [Oscillospiraceae bacterium]
MRTFKKLLAVFLALTVLAGMLAMPVSAASVVQDGLEVTLSTDRESYARGDSVEATLTVTNTGDTQIENIAIESVIPQGYRLEEGSEGAKFVQSLSSGQTVTLLVRLLALPSEEETEPAPTAVVAPGALVPEADTLTTGTVDETSEEPEESGNAVVWIALAAAVVLSLLVVLRGQKRKRAMCLLLCGAMLSSLALGNPAQAAQSDEKTLQVSAEIPVEGQSVTLMATVTYQIPEPEQTVQIPVGCLVTFESNGGSRIPAQAVAEGSAAVRPGDPIRDGSVFGDWYADQALTRLYDFASPVTGDLTLYASWSQDPAEISVEDDDGDGIPNLLETLFELSDETNDTDSDGIDDYTEIFLVGSDPSVADSSQDKDSDGLSNYDEVILFGTDATLADTDRDGLPDGEEVSQAESGILVLPDPQILGPVDTNPLLYDTDGDGLRDGMERQMGTDPKVPDPFFHTSATAENAHDTVTASVSVDLSGVQVETLKVQPVDSTLFSGEMPGYLGKAYDFTVDGEFETATIRFEFDPVLLEDGAAPKIFYFNEETQTLEELETTITGNVASTVVEHFSTYILLDRTTYDGSFTWDDVWDSTGTYS